MLDTIKVSIPITEKQHQRLHEEWLKCGSPQWGLFNPHEGDITLRRIRHLVETDQNSFHRELRLDFPDRWDETATLALEFSLPKLWYGHNIHLLYDWVGALEATKKRIEQQFRLTRMRLPDVTSWKVLRADVCYAWRFPSQAMAQAYLDSLKVLKFPWKTPIIYQTSILFAGKTYSVKVYLKHPEFLKHDRRELLKQKASLSWIEHLEAISKGVLRFEVTLRHRWLKERGIRTVGELGRYQPFVVWEDDAVDYLGQDLPFGFLAVTSSLGDRGQHLLNKNYEAFKPGELLKAKPGHYQLGIDGHWKGTLTLEKEIALRIYPSGTTMTIIQEMLAKFIGEGNMHSNHQVQEKLLQVFTSQKAARLTAFWVYVQEFGVEKAKNIFGKNSFYCARADLKSAGIDLIERPDNLVFLDDEFERSYRMKAPSTHTTNPVDDFRDSGNVLNAKHLA